MTILTVWAKPDTWEIQLHQLSEVPEDGTPAEQIAYLATLAPFEDYTCVSEDYLDTVPETDPALWRWSDGQVIAIAPPIVVPASITRRQCARQLLTMSMITGPEAVAMTRNGTPPAMVQAYLDTLPEESQYLAEIDFAADTYLRDNPLLNMIMAAGGHPPEAVDQFFIAAAAL